MAYTDLKFFTNEPERDLYSRFAVILKNNTQFFDVLVGYFRTSGFFKLYPALEDVEKIRVLVGLNVDKYTVDIIDQANAEQPTIKQATEQFDYVLFECLDDPRAMDLYEFLEWRRQFKCKAGLAHTDIFKLGEMYGLDIIKLMRDNDIFWELNTSGNYMYYYDFLTNEKKQQIIKESGIPVSVGSDTHYITEYRKKQIRRANELLQRLSIPLP